MQSAGIQACPVWAYWEDSLVPDAAGQRRFLQCAAERVRQSG